MTELARLTRAEEDYLVQCEETISHGLQTFVEVGTALAMIRDNRLYRAEHATFELYCAERWGFRRQRANELIAAARMVDEISSTGAPVPANEAQAVALARVPDATRADVWRETYERTDGKPTAAAIRETYERTQTPARRDPEPTIPGPAVATTGGPGTNSPAGPAPASPSLGAPMDRPGSGHSSATGEAHAGLDDDALGPASTSEAPAGVAPAGAGDPIADLIANDPGVKAAELRMRLNARMEAFYAGITAIDPAHLAAVADVDLLERVERMRDRLNEWADQVQTTHRRTRLKVV